MNEWMKEWMNEWKLAGLRTQDLFAFHFFYKSPPISHSGSPSQKKPFQGENATAYFAAASVTKKNVSFTTICGLYYKAITIVIMTIVSDATIWSVTFDAARGVIYDRNMAIPHVYGTGVICDDRQMTIVIVL